MTQVFISYSHDSDEHRTFVRELSDRLRNEGLDCLIDQYINGFPEEGWQRWMENQIEAADFVLLVCTETYLVAGAFDTKVECSNLISYLKTRFLRFLVLLNKPTQHATSKVYQFVPIQDFSEFWTDEILYKKYNITEDEIAFIESMIRPMDASVE